MKKIKLTKIELKKQRENLKRYNRFLPTLHIKKQQLQIEINRVRMELQDIEDKIESTMREMEGWISLFGEEVGLEELISLKNIETKEENIAGVDIP
ncbi:MAG: V-type ATP synthase subunit D, partial [Nitrospirae bacterium]